MISPQHWEADLASTYNPNMPVIRLPTVELEDASEGPGLLTRWSVGVVVSTRVSQLSIQREVKGRQRGKLLLQGVVTCGLLPGSQGDWRGMPCYSATRPAAGLGPHPMDLSQPITGHSHTCWAGLHTECQVLGCKYITFQIWKLFLILIIIIYLEWVIGHISQMKIVIFFFHFRFKLK